MVNAGIKKLRKAHIDLHQSPRCLQATVSVFILRRCDQSQVYNKGSVVIDNLLRFDGRIVDL